ncbi:hypothetical protein [Rhizobium sp. BK251]|uniref:hypothetical protein n=1 Tax=Rhizobium sp. BK251 TaxID=2512125 RepID=UPI00104AEFE1|nr:hypothetical protein [Rhizobium sp. BK251]TCL70517.1 hypothetical protein EV286_107392 [Rhizobium sp. BK251]
MDLAYLAKNAAIAERARRRMRREGVTMKGHKLWTDAERDVLRELAPDYNAMCKRLPHRTHKAIEGECARLGLRKKIHIWTAAEISKLRRLYPNASVEEICATFPHSTWTNIQQAARYHNLFRSRKPYKLTGNHPVDSMLKRLLPANVNLADLDKELRTKRYFRKQKWRHQRPNYNRLVKAIEWLDGRLEVHWND